VARLRWGRLLPSATTPQHTTEGQRSGEEVLRFISYIRPITPPPTTTALSFLKTKIPPNPRSSPNAPISDTILLRIPTAYYLALWHFAHSLNSPLTLLLHFRTVHVRISTQHRLALPTWADLKLRIETVARDPSGGPVAASGHAANQAAYTASGFANHSRSPSDGQGGGQGSPIAAAHTLPHGYNHAPPAQNEAHIHPELRSADAVPTSSAYPAVPIPNMMPAASLSPSDQTAVMAGPTAAIGVAPGGVDHGEYSAEGRKAKRELSQSKRAAQNRAAQVSRPSGTPQWTVNWLGIQQCGGGASNS
jgi:hypothetical protein